MSLLEREVLMAEFQKLVLRARSRDGLTLAVTGEAGVGKTSLLREAVAQARESLRPFVAGCEDLFTPRPFGPFFDLAEELAIDPRAPRETFFPSVLAAATREPSLLIVEDVHWADRATLDLLKYLARRTDGTPLLLTISYRDDEVVAGHPLIGLLGEAAIRRMHVKPLSREAVVQLGGDPALHALTGGNPFYVTEVLASGSGDVPPTVRDAVLARARPLSPSARGVLELASLIPGRAELGLLEAAAEDVEAAAASGIVRIEEGAIVFRHELARRAIEGTISDVRRVPIHRALLRRLEGEGSLAHLAHHAVGARDSEAILRYAPAAAAEAATASAHREAASHYRHALSWSGSLSDAERAALIEALSYECYLTDQIEEALQRRREALELWKKSGDRRREGDNLRWQSRLFWFLGRNAEARAMAAEAIGLLEDLGPSPELAMAYSNRSQLHMLAQEVTHAIDLGTRAANMAAAIGDRAVLAHALNNVGTAEMFLGGDGQALLQSLELSREHGFQEHAARAYTNLASGLVRSLDYDTARRYLDEGLRWCVVRDLDSWMLYLSAWQARLELETGRWQEAEEAAQRVMRHPGAAAISRIPALAVWGRLLARRGAPSAETILDEARDLASGTGEYQRVAPVAAARAEAAWLRGEPAERIVAEAEPAFRNSPLTREPWQHGELALAMWRGGAIDSAPEGVAQPYALQIAGKAREAAAAFAAAGRPWESAAALAESDDPAALQDALAILERLGDGAVLERVRQQLRSRGVRGPRTSTLANPAGLTAREAEIVTLLDEGLRNADIAARLFLSAKTVDHHVSSILAKLGAKTRGEAVRRYKERTRGVRS